jgi:F-type H+-transporting ATPase subunit alpha
MKKLAGPVRTELAQYRELAAFAQFGSDLDKDTLARLRQGERLVEIFKQPQYKPLDVSQQVIILFVATRGHLTDVNVEKVIAFQQAFLTYMDEKHSDIINEITNRKDIDEALEKRLVEVITAFKSSANFKNL